MNTISHHNTNIGDIIDIDGELYMVAEVIPDVVLIPLDEL